MTVILGASTPSAEDMLAIRWERSRVRPHDEALTTVIRAAVERSKTLRSLITKIDGTNGIVYIHPAKCPGHVKACLFQHIQLSGPNRVLHIGVSVIRRGEVDIASSIGHELQHAWEVLQRPDVTSSTGMLGVWTAGLKYSTEAYETSEAIDVGTDVRRELSATDFSQSR
jgi:hypothetical protein